MIPTDSSIPDGTGTAQLFLRTWVYNGLQVQTRIGPDDRDCRKQKSAHNESFSLPQRVSDSMAMDTAFSRSLTGFSAACDSAQMSRPHTTGRRNRSIFVDGAGTWVVKRKC